MGRAKKKPPSWTGRWFNQERREFLKAVTALATALTALFILAGNVRDFFAPPNRTPAPPPSTPKRHVLELHDTLKLEAGEQHAVSATATKYAGASTTNTISGSIRLTPKP